MYVPGKSGLGAEHNTWARTRAPGFSHRVVGVRLDGERAEDEVFGVFGHAYGHQADAKNLVMSPPVTVCDRLGVSLGQGSYQGSNGNGAIGALSGSNEWVDGYSPGRRSERFGYSQAYCVSHAS